MLAAVAGPTGVPVTYATIARLRKGQTRPRPALLARLSELLGVGEDELIGGDAPKSRKKSLARPLFPLKPEVAQIPATLLPPPDSLEARMARIVAIQQQMADAVALKSELVGLIDSVASELTRIKNSTATS